MRRAMAAIAIVFLGVLAALILVSASASDAVLVEVALAAHFANNAAACWPLWAGSPW